MALVGYDSSDEETKAEIGTESEVHNSLTPLQSGLLNSAPITGLPSNSLTNYSGQLNVKYALDRKPLLGPQNPYKDSSLKRKNMITGHAEEQYFDEATFRIQHRTFQELGYARNPTINSSEIVGDIAKGTALENRDIVDLRPSKEVKRDIRSKRQKKGDASVLDGENAYKGPWAQYKDDIATSSSESEGEPEEPTEIQNTVDEEPDIPVRIADSGDRETTEFNGSQEFDYLGRTYMHVPQDLDVNFLKEPGQDEWYMPKKKIHTWSGHNGGVNKLRFFPGSGHLLMSCGNDAKIKLWDAHHSRELLRTFMGHTKAVKDIDFSNDGRQFLSCSYDKMVKLWDTETGKCLARYPQESVPNVVKFNPLPERQGEFVVGLANTKVAQFDIATKQIVQEYDHHLGPINTITFIDKSYRFMTTSDDKTIRIWDWQINTPIKLITDPNQHSMPVVKLHPSGKYVAAQSMDNKIVVVGATDRFRENRKKFYTGHNSAGYAVGLGFSPDGQYLISGDTHGSVYFWNWKTTSLKNKIKAHNSAVLCVETHPHETSKLATAGLDGPIYYWD
jgi:pre-mRNA-processing factor 17